MNNFKTFIYILAFLVSFIKINAQTIDNKKNSQNYHLEKILNNDGTINTNSNIYRSFDFRDYKMIYGKNNEPVFIPQHNPDIAGDENWSSNFSGPTGANNFVYAVVKDRYNNIYIGGDFENVCGVSAKNIAKWDGVSWSPLGEGTDNLVTTLAVDTLGNLYAGGLFNNAGNISASNIAKWDGNSWSALGSGVSSIVYCIKIDEAGNLYAGGNFTSAGGITANRIAKWDGNNWSAIGSGVNNIVFAIEIDIFGNVYIGGMFVNVGGLAGNSYLLKYDGTSWEPLGSGLNHYVYSMVFNDNYDLVVGGEFTRAGGNDANHIAKWNGTSWSAIGSGTNGSVQSVKISANGNIYAAGEFTEADNNTANNIAMWDGTAWSALGEGTNKKINAIDCDKNGNLSICGYFSSAGEIGASYIANWNGSEWGTFGYGNSLNYTVNDMAIDSLGNVYLGGWFTTAGNVNANHVVKWNGTSWTALGEGTNDWVTAITLDKYGNIYIGGWFTKIGNNTVNHIAKWDGNQWTSLGSGTNAVVRTLATDTAGILYAGGDFTTADGITVNYIAKWDGNQWSAIGTGMSDKVKTLVVDKNNNLYAGGNFIFANGVYVSRVGKYDGTNWSILYSGLGGSVYDLAVDSYGNLIACGDFWDNNASTALYRIAKWNGSQWLPLGYGSMYEIDAVATDDFGNIYAGGYFQQIGEINTNNIARWNGSEWTNLGSGTNYYVYSLKTFKNSVFCGGRFLKAGNKNSAYFAQYINPVEINIKGNSISIIDGDLTPDLSDNTDFGTSNIGNSITKTFRIINEGEYPLIFSESPRVLISGTDFVLTADLPEYINIGDSADFEITFTPSSCGTILENVSILNNDEDENPYNFSISGTGLDNVAPETPTLESITEECSVTVSIPTTTDNCDGLIYGTTTNSTTYNQQGTYTITWTFTDNAGNYTTQNQTIIIDDNTPPVPDLTNLPDVTGECYVVVTSSPTATDNCGGSVLVTTNSPLTYTEQGTFTITWYYNDGRENISSQNQTVIVADNTNPVIYCPQNAVRNLQQNQSFYTVLNDEFNPVLAYDNCETESIINDFNELSTLENAELPVGTTPITWTITDMVGNETSCSFNVLVNTFVGIETLEQNKIYISPNPTSSKLIVKSGKLKVKNIEIYDITGRVVISNFKFQNNFTNEVNNSEYMIDLSEQTAGIYFMKIETGKGVFVEKIIKQ